jgi:hypothetical protein
MTPDNGFDTTSNTSRSRGPSQHVRGQVIERAGGRCEWCGGQSTWGVSVHHRQPRGMGGSRKVHVNAAANLMLLCGSGTTGCHGWVESHRREAVTWGLLVPRPGLPSVTPVFYRRTEWVLLDDNGGVHSWTPDDGADDVENETIIVHSADDPTLWRS